MKVDEQGRFHGYASVFGEPDKSGDIVVRGAFSATLAASGPKQIRMLFQHDPKEPIGVFSSIFEDHYGLKVHGQLVGEVPRARALIDLIAADALDGLSIGFRTQKATRDRAGAFRRLLQVELWEISIVTFPMMDAARIVSGPSVPAQLDRSIGARQITIAAAISALRNH